MADRKTPSPRLIALDGIGKKTTTARPGSAKGASSGPTKGASGDATIHHHHRKK